MPQYLLQQPKKLESVAIDKLAAWLALQATKFLTPIWELRRLDSPAKAENVLSRQIDILRNHFSCNMPRKFHDKMMSKTMIELLSVLEKTKRNNSGQISESQRKVIERMAETLLTVNLTTLSLNICDFGLNTMLADSLRSKSQLLTGLVRLELNYWPPIPRTANTEFDVITLLEKLYSLKYVTIEKICTDNILRCIVNNCRSIEELNISPSDHVNDNSMDILAKLHNLRSINLSNTMVGQKGIETLLLNCKNIEHIVTLVRSYDGSYSGYKMPQVLKRIADSNDKFPKLLKIKSYRSYNDSLEELQLLIQMCPLIRNLSIRGSFTYTKRRSDNIMAITGLRDLRELTLEEYGFHIDEVKEVLQVIGSNLMHLHLLRVDQIDLNALIDISQMCPNLQSLSINSCRFIEQASCAQEIRIQAFTNLKELIFLNTSSSVNVCRPQSHSWCGWRPPASAADKEASKLRLEKYFKLVQEVGFFLFSSCLNVEFIELSTSTWFTENFMMKVLDKNPLAYLKELKIKNHFQRSKVSETLTTFVIDRIIHNSVNCPQVILEVN